MEARFALHYNHIARVPQGPINFRALRHGRRGGRRHRCGERLLTACCCAAVRGLCKIDYVEQSGDPVALAQSPKAFHLVPIES